jgi:hypothetical protein
MVVLTAAPAVPNVLRMSSPLPGKHTLAVEVMLEGRLRADVISKLSKAITENWHCLKEQDS